MDIFQAILLGAIQGLTEFIPVSSSAHLDLVPKVLGWKNPNTVFDTFIHIGTFLALLFFYRKKILKYTRSLLKIYKYSSKEDKENILIIRNVLISTIPAFLIGIFFNNLISVFYDSSEYDEISNFFIIASMFFLGIVFIVYPSFLKNKKVSISNLSIKKSFLIGFFQIFAFFRGVSRSGITILTGQFLGLKRVDAADFSFLMSIPIIFSTSIYSIYNLLKDYTDYNFSSEELFAYLLGMFSAFIFGAIAINFLLNFLKKYSLKVFGYYRIMFAVFMFILLVN